VLQVVVSETTSSSVAVRIFRWWKSKAYNPNIKPRKWLFGNDRDFGHGFHYLLLEGEAVYLEKTRICPYDGFTTGAAKAWRARGRRH
jgi:hypothetical protein